MKSPIENCVQEPRAYLLIETGEKTEYNARRSERMRERRQEEEMGSWKDEAFGRKCKCVA
jgi:hypothetical protein